MNDHVRRCHRCGEEKSLDDFYALKTPRAKQPCKACVSAERKAHYRDNAEQLRAKRRERHDPAKHRAAWMRATYGITIEDYVALLAAQGGVCAVCGSSDPKRGETFHIDHDHATGEVRGLLCLTCNMGIGALGDDPDRVFAAWGYLTGSSRPRALVKESSDR